MTLAYVNQKRVRSVDWPEREIDQKPNVAQTHFLLSDWSSRFLASVRKALIGRAPMEESRMESLTLSATLSFLPLFPAVTEPIDLGIMQYALTRKKEKTIPLSFNRLRVFLRGHWTSQERKKGCLSVLTQRMRT